MKFRTELTPIRSRLTLSPEKPAVLVGSCFSDNITARMRRCLWNAANPLGTLYNPLSIGRALRVALDPEGDTFAFEESVFTDASGISHSWLFDSGLSARNNREAVTEEFKCRAQVTDEMLRDAQALFVTFGTSICYFLTSDPEYVVGNCHKQPSTLFQRRRLGIVEIVDLWVGLAADLRKRYPELAVVFTVSPVRHLRDGFVENNRSKAVLQLAIEEICRRVENCHYFPAYELLNDDLRDYRFYASDMAHPSEEAVDYVWDFFKRTYLDDEGLETLRQGEAIYRAYHHRPNIPLRTDADVALVDSARKEVLRRWSTFNATHHGTMLALSND